MSIIFFIMFLVIISVIIYLIYDFINYKENVDKSIVKTTSFINQNFEKVSDNISSTEKNLSENIDKTNKDLTTFKDSANMQDMVINTKIDDINTNLDNFDNALKKYFTFMDNNNQAISNKKIFNHIFESITPNLKLMANVEAVNGMTIRTSQDLINNKNLKICNSTNNCLQLNVNNDGFNITPDNIKNLTINNSNNTPLAKFDMQNNSIYFGGSDINAPMFINNSNLYLNNINMIIKPPGTKYNQISDLGETNIARLTGEDIYTYKNNMSNIMNEMSKAISQEVTRYSNYYNNTKNFIDENKSIFQSSLDSTKSIANKIVDMSKQAVIYYSLKNIYTTSSTTQNVEPINELYFKILPNQDLKIGDVIEFEIPYYEIGNMVLSSTNNTKTYNIQNVNEQVVDIQNSSIEAGQTTAFFKIQILSEITKNQTIFFIITGTMLSNTDQINKNGVALGIIKRNNEYTSIETSYNKINDFWNNKGWEKA